MQLYDGTYTDAMLMQVGINIVLIADCEVQGRKVDTPSTTRQATLGATEQVARPRRVKATALLVPTGPVGHPGER